MKSLNVISPRLPLLNSNLVCIYHADSEHDMVKSQVLLELGEDKIWFCMQWNWKKMTMDTNHQVREVNHHFKVNCIQGFPNMSKFNSNQFKKHTDGSHVHFVALIKLTRSHCLENEHLHHASSENLDPVACTI
ncbi:hypothetical protein BHM03_00053310 [Ensete ventricosum]|nr:hypothetical protein BHM03_00053310 [Ensete ventricosum]